jgi:hypothetical protein
MSIYRNFRRSPLSDVHHIEEHVAKPPDIGQAPAPKAPQQDWTNLRRGSPAAILFPATARWIGALPTDVQPKALSASFPRIANMLASVWPAAAAFDEYITDLLVDKRGGRMGFSIEVLADLHRLRAYRGGLNPDLSAR